MYRKVLIANRGEIAVRIARTLQQMGVATVAVFSEPDRGSPHVSACDEAYPLEGKTSGETYLQGAKIIEIAKSHGVDAIHPGFGFLSENATFAKAVADAGLTFIGPKPEVIRAMGDKISAKKAFAAAGVPVVPGWSGSMDEASSSIAREAERIGYPVLIKAAAGGGGKGMRAVVSPTELSSAIESAQREAAAAFGDGRVFMEKLIERPRHVEIQILGDHHGNVVHLFERECSIQRRHQKIVEESPSPALTPDLRERMGSAAVTAAKAAGYTNAGTVEFMVDPHGAFYFLEVNTRLQVEHPVTEMVTRLDLVEWQLRIAAGERLPFAQSDLRQDGHALEVRIYAEDASRGFMPSIGKINAYAPPRGPNIRVDDGVREGSEVSVYYDPMLAKLIVWGRSREESIRRMIWALDRYVVLGVTTNIEFLRTLLDHAEFRTGRIHTGFLSEQTITAESNQTMPDEVLIAAALATTKPSGAVTAGGTAPNDADRLGPWSLAHAWRVA